MCQGVASLVRLPSLLPLAKRYISMAMPGFKPLAAGKAVYFDDHERDDAVEEREAYLGRLKEIDQCNNVIRVYCMFVNSWNL